MKIYKKLFCAIFAGVLLFACNIMYCHPVQNDYVNKMFGGDLAKNMSFFLVVRLSVFVFPDFINVTPNDFEDKRCTFIQEFLCQLNELIEKRQNDREVFIGVIKDLMDQSEHIKGFFCNKVDYDGNTVFHYIAKFNCVSLLKLLLDEKLTNDEYISPGGVDRVNLFKQTPQKTAALHKNFDCLRIFMGWEDGYLKNAYESFKYKADFAIFVCVYF